MKQKRPIDQQEGSRKKQRRILDLLQLPQEIIQKCFILLTRRDIVSLSCLDKRHRRQLTNEVFSKIKCCWHNLILEEQRLTFREYARQVRIIDTYSYGEWQIDLFAILEKNFPNAQVLYINSTNSTNWLKYRSSKKMTELSLYYEKGHNETEEIRHNDNPKGTHHKINLSCPKIFNLSNLNNFEQLNSINIEGYHFHWDESEVVNTFNLANVSLINCTWEYPFDPRHFNHHGTIKTFSITYTHNHPFILLERFNKFLNSPMLDYSSSIEGFSIIFEKGSSSFLRHFTPNMLQRLTSSEFPHLRTLALRGWLVNTSDFRDMVQHLDPNHLRRLDLKLFLCDNCLSRRKDLIEAMGRDIKRTYTWLTFRLSVEYV